jgi:hypothetical protein
MVSWDDIKGCGWWPVKGRALAIIAWLVVSWKESRLKSNTTEVVYRRVPYKSDKHLTVYSDSIISDLIICYSNYQPGNQ